MTENILPLEPSKEEEAHYKASEEQDHLIARGIRLISQKVLDLLQLCSRFKIDPDDERSYTLLST